MRGGGVGVVLVEADKVNNKASRVAKQTEKINMIMLPANLPGTPTCHLRGSCINLVLTLWNYIKPHSDVSQCWFPFNWFEQF